MARARRKRRRYAAPIGGAFLLLALAGLAAVVIMSINLTDRLLDNQREKERLEDIIRPVLMWDPPPFENPADVDPTQMLYFCMWAALMDENANYGFDVNQEMQVPASDLDVAAATLFGPDVALEHRTFGEYEQSYYYDPARQVYSVPVNVQLYLYSPQVEEIERNGEFYDVRVGYVPPQGAYTANVQGNRGEPEPDKYMIYVVRQAGNTYRLVALRDDPASMGETHMPAAS